MQRKNVLQFHEFVNFLEMARNPLQPSGQIREHEYQLTWQYLGMQGITSCHSFVTYTTEWHQLPDGPHSSMPQQMWMQPHINVDYQNSTMQMSTIPGALIFQNSNSRVEQKRKTNNKHKRRQYTDRGKSIRIAEAKAQHISFLEPPSDSSINDLDATLTYSQVLRKSVDDEASKQEKVLLQMPSESVKQEEHPPEMSVGPAKLEEVPEEIPIMKYEEQAEHATFVASSQSKMSTVVVAEDPLSKKPNTMNNTKNNWLKPKGKMAFRKQEAKDLRPDNLQNKLPMQYSRNRFVLQDEDLQEKSFSNGNAAETNKQSRIEEAKSTKRQKVPKSTKMSSKTTKTQKRMAKQAELVDEEQQKLASMSFGKLSFKLLLLQVQKTSRTAMKIVTDWCNRFVNYLF